MGGNAAFAFRVAVPLPEGLVNSGLGVSRNGGTGSGRGIGFCFLCRWFLFFCRLPFRWGQIAVCVNQHPDMTGHFFIAYFPPAAVFVVLNTHTGSHIVGIPFCAVSQGKVSTGPWWNNVRGKVVNGAERFLQLLIGKSVPIPFLYLLFPSGYTPVLYQKGVNICLGDKGGAVRSGICLGHRESGGRFHALRFLNPLNLLLFRWEQVECQL